MPLVSTFKYATIWIMCNGLVRSSNFFLTKWTICSSSEKQKDSALSRLYNTHHTYPVGPNQGAVPTNNTVGVSEGVRIVYPRESYKIFGRERIWLVHCTHDVPPPQPAAHTPPSLPWWSPPSNPVPFGLWQLPTRVMTASPPLLDHPYKPVQPCTPSLTIQEARKGNRSREEGKAAVLEKRGRGRIGQSNNDLASINPLEEECTQESTQGKGRGRGRRRRQQRANCCCYICN